MSQDTFADLQDPFADLKDPFSDLTDPFADLTDPFAQAPAEPKVKRGGWTGVLQGGIESAGRAIGSAYDAVTGDNASIVERANANKNVEKDAALSGFYGDIEASRKQLGEDAGLVDSAGAVAGAIGRNKEGAAKALVEQLPNSAAALGGGWAGMKAGAVVGSFAGPVGAAVGGVVGGIAGMFLGNAALEVGNKAMESAEDGVVTDEERTGAIREGGTKAAVITAVDAVTLGGSKWLTGVTSRAMESATRKTLMDAGVDVTSRAAIEAARKVPEISRAVLQAQEAVVTATSKFSKKAASYGAAGALETVGEGVGEYVGELAATGKADMIDAVLESALSAPQSGAEVAWGVSRNDAEARNKQWEEAPEPEAKPLALPNNGGAVQYVFPDGSATTDPEAARRFVETLPADQRNAAYEQLLSGKWQKPADMKAELSFPDPSAGKPAGEDAGVQDDPNINWLDSGPRTQEQRMGQMAEEADRARVKQQKERELLRLVGDSKLTAELDRAEERDTITRAAGRDVPLEGQMQAAFQGAQADSPSADPQAAAQPSEQDRALAQRLLNTRTTPPPQPPTPTRPDMLNEFERARRAAEAQKAAELEQLAAESRVPAAEFDAQRSDRIMEAAGVGDQQPSAMQIAMQRAQGGSAQPAPAQNMAQLRDADRAMAARLLRARTGPSGTVPEPAADIAAQVNAYAEGARGPVFVDGDVQATTVPEGMAVVPSQYGGNYIAKSEDAAAIEQIEATTGDKEIARKQILGYTQTKPDAMAGGAPVIVQARNAEGQVVKQELVDGNDPQALQAAQQSQAQAGAVEVTTPDAAMAERLDPGELNIPGRTNGINAELDRYKRDQAAQKKNEAKQGAADRKAAKAQAKQLFAEVGQQMADSTAAKHPQHTAASVRKELDQMVKWQPALFISLANRFKAEQASQPAPAPDQVPGATEMIAPKAEPAPKAKRGPVPRGEAKSLLELIRRNGGIAKRLENDIAGEPTVRKKGYPVGVFREGGMREDMLAELMQQQGYLLESDVMGSDSGAELAFELVRSALTGERIVPIAERERLMADAEEKAYRDGIREAANEAGIKIVGRKFSDLEADVLALRERQQQAKVDALEAADRALYDEVLQQVRDSGIMEESEIEALIERNMNAPLRELAQLLEDAYLARIEEINAELADARAPRELNEEEYQDAFERENQGEAGSAAARAPSQRDEVGSREADQREAAPDAAAGREGFQLEGQTERELKARIDALEAAEAERKKQEAEAERRAQADAERGQFMLTGSDRPADVLAAQGQTSIFDAPAQPAPTQAPTASEQSRPTPSPRSESAQPSPDARQARIDELKAEYARLEARNKQLEYDYRALDAQIPKYDPNWLDSRGRIKPNSRAAVDAQRKAQQAIREQQNPIIDEQSRVRRELLGVSSELNQARIERMDARAEARRAKAEAPSATPEPITLVSQKRVRDEGGIDGVSTRLAFSNGAVHYISRGDSGSNGGLDGWHGDGDLYFGGSWLGDTKDVAIAELLRRMNQVASRSRESRASTAVTESENFRAWFGESTITDGDGEPLRMYHGTTHPDIEVFVSAGTTESFLGKGPYFTSSPQDASDNYAGVGPDLTNRIEREAERIADDFHGDDYTAEEVLRDYFDDMGIDLETIGIEDVEDALEDLKDEHGEAAIAHAAHKALKGASDGLMMPVYLKVEHPFDMTGDQQLYLEYDTDEDGDIIGEERGEIVTLIESIRNVAAEYGFDRSGDIDDFIDWLYSNGADGLSPREIFDHGKSNVQIYYDAEGEATSFGQFWQDVLRDTGLYDGIVMDADLYFGTQKRGFMGARIPGMSGVTPGTIHVVPFSPEQVKSAIGNNGNFDPSKRSILESRGRSESAAAITNSVSANTDKVRRLRDRAAKILGEDSKLVRFAEQLLSRADGQPISGRYTPAQLRSIIEVALNSRNPLGALNHEAFHHALEAFFTPAQVRIIKMAFAPGGALAAKVKKQLRLDGETAVLADREYLDSEELSAFGFQYFAAGRLQFGADVGRIFQALGNMVERVRNWINGAGFNTVEELFEALDQGKLGPQGPQGGGRRSQAPRQDRESRAGQGRQAQAAANSAPTTGQPAAAANPGLIARARQSFQWLDSILHPLGRMEDQRKYLLQRYKTMGAIAKWEEIGKQIYDTLKKADKADAKATFAYLTTKGAAPNGIRNAEIRAKAVEVKAIIDQVGQALVKRGLIPQASFEKYRDSYLPRMYLRYLLDDKINQFATTGAGRKPSSLGYTKARKELDPEVREVLLGEVQDPAFLSATGIVRSMRDLFLLHWLEQISENEKWVLPKGTVEWNGQRVTPHWLKTEAEQLRKQADFYDDPVTERKARQVARDMDAAADAAFEAMGQSEVDIERYKQMPDAARYGRLRGLWVRNEIYDDIMGVAGMAPENGNWLASTFGYGGIGTKITQAFKTTKVTLNPASQVRNFVSNMVLLQLSGVPLHRLPGLMKKAVNEMANGGRHYKIAKKYGITESSFSSQELFRMKKELLDLEERLHGLSAWGKVQKFAGVIVEFAGEKYQKVEEFGKVMKIIDGMERQQLSEEDAILEAQKWLFDYSLVPGWLRYARNAPIGAPFMTFTIKVLPRLLEAATKHPQRFIPWVGMWFGLAAMTAASLGYDEDEMKAAKASLPEWAQKRSHVALLPFKGEDGRLTYIDLGYHFPWTMWLDLTRATASGDPNAMLSSMGALSGPIPDLLIALRTNTDAFTGRKIWEEIDPLEVRAGKMAGYLFNMALPPWMATNGPIAKLMEQDEVDRFGDQKTDAGQAIGQAAGFPYRKFDPAQQRGANIKRMQYELSMAERRMKAELAGNRNASPEERAEIRDTYVEHIRSMADEIRDYAKRSAMPAR